MMTVPAPLAYDGVVTHDPATKSLLVKVSGLGGTYYRRGHAAMMQAEESGRYGAPTVWARAAGLGEVGRSEPIAGGRLRFKLDAATYRQLAGAVDSALVTVDRTTNGGTRVLAVPLFPLADKKDAPQHQPGCVLDPVYWLRHAIAAVGRLVPLNDDPDLDVVDRIAAGALTDTLAHFAELPDWATVTLHDVAQQATLMNQDRFDEFCTCGATGSR